MTCPKMEELREIFTDKGINFGDPILMEVSRRALASHTWAMVSNCECGEVFTAVSGNPDNCRKLISRKARRHWGPKIGGSKPEG